MKKLTLLSLSLTLGGSTVLSASTLLHYRVNSSDEAGVIGGTVPGIDGSADGTVDFGAVTLSANIPANRPAGGGDRALVFDGASGINLPGTQQLLNSDIDAAGGFTMEAWVTYSGGGNVNSIIDYAGTEKLVRRAAATGLSMTASGVGDPLIAVTGQDEWHYVAVVFSSTSLTAGSITGDFTFYLDGTTPVSTLTDQTIDDFGDSLNRTISVGAHPLGFAGDFYNGLIYEPRVSSGALASGDLLIASAVPEPGSTSLLLLSFGALFLRRKR